MLEGVQNVGVEAFGFGHMDARMKILRGLCARPYSGTDVPVPKSCSTS